MMKQISPKVSPIGRMGTEGLVLPNHSGDNVKGFVSKTPVNDKDFANKKYVDDNAVSPAGSTGEIQFNNAGSFGADSDLFWDNVNKRLGIGTSSPAKRLDIDTGYFRMGNYIYTPGTWIGVKQDSGVAAEMRYGALAISNAYSDAAPTNGLYVKGKVGIGTTSPSQKLHVVGNFILGQNNETDGVAKAFRFGVGHYTNSEEPFCPFYGYASASNNDAVFGGGTGYGNAATRIKFYTAANRTTLTGTERMRIDSSGRVGINTTAPTEKLDVNSDAIRIRTAQTPASAGATGTAGMICWDASYIYVCTATNTWKRTAIATW